MTNTLGKLSEANKLKPNIIAKIRWIKLEKRCKPGQWLAHTSFALTSAEEANICIRDRVMVHGIKTYPSRLKQEPT